MTRLDGWTERGCVFGIDTFVIVAASDGPCFGCEHHIVIVMCHLHSKRAPALCVFAWAQSTPPPESLPCHSHRCHCLKNRYCSCCYRWRKLATETAVMCTSAVAVPGERVDSGACASAARAPTAVACTPCRCFERRVTSIAACVFISIMVTKIQTSITGIGTSITNSEVLSTARTH